MSTEFRADGLPITQGSKTVYRGRAVESRRKVLLPWRETIAAAAKAAHVGPLLAGPVVVTLEFALPRPKSHPKRRRTWPISRNDVDKLARACLDAMTGAVYVDDGQVVDLRSVKDWGPVPGVTVRVSAVEDSGA